MTGPLKVLGFLFWTFSFSFVRGQVIPRTPTLSIFPGTIPLLCVIKDFYPKDLTVQWKVDHINCSRQSKLHYELNADGLYTAYSDCKVSGEMWRPNSQYSCEVTHQGKTISKTIINSNTNLTLKLKPPNVREIFVNNKVVLEAVVSGDEVKTVREASVSCKVKNQPVNTVMGNINFYEDISQFIRIHNITIDTKKWFDGETVTCIVRDTNYNRDIKQEISFDKGDGRRPNVVIYTPDFINSNTVSLVCEVTSSKLGDVYIAWKVNEGFYIEGSTSARIPGNNSTSVLSILTVPKQQYSDFRTTITCAVKHANMENIMSPSQVTTSKRKQLELSCD